MIVGEWTDENGKRWYLFNTGSRFVLRSRAPSRREAYRRGFWSSFDLFGDEKPLDSYKRYRWAVANKRRAKNAERQRLPGKLDAKG